MSFGSSFFDTLVKIPAVQIFRYSCSFIVSYCVGSWYYSRSDENNNGTFSIFKAAKVLFLNNFGTIVLISIAKLFFFILNIFLIILEAFIWILYICCFCVSCCIAVCCCNCLTEKVKKMRIRIDQF